MPWTVDDVDRFNEGLTVVEKERWVVVANDVYAKCLEDGGADADCAAEAIKQANSAVKENCNCGELHLIKANVDGQIRTAKYDGEDYLIAPVVLLVEGVHVGNGGALFYPAEELAKFPEIWNDTPVTVGHPQRNGVACSCAHPDIIETQSVGRLYNVEYRDGKLIGELWLNQRKLKDFPEVTHYLNQGVLEVSTGLFSDAELTGGVWNDEEYDAVVRHMRSDHLALLPGGKGACSISDGCGAPRANAQTQTKEESVADPTAENEATETPETNAAVTEAEEADTRSFLQKMRDRFFGGPLKSNEVSFSRINAELSRQLDALDNAVVFHWIYDVFEDYFVYVTSPGGESTDNKETMYRRSYTVDKATDAVVMGDDPQEVVMQVSFKVVDNIENTEVKENMTDKPCCPEKVQSLIDNENTAYQEDDKEWLSGLTEVQIDKLTDSVMVAAPTDNEDAAEEEEAVVENEEAAEEEETVVENEEEPVAETLEERESREYGARLYKNEKAKLVKRILANSKRFTEKALWEKPFEDLEGMADLIKDADYSAAGGSVTENAETVEAPLLPPAFQNKE